MFTNFFLFTLKKDYLPYGDSKRDQWWNSFRNFFPADTNNPSFADLFGNLAATSTPMKANLQSAFNSHNGSNNNSNYIQTTPPKNSFENFQVRLISILNVIDWSRILMISLANFFSFRRLSSRNFKTHFALIFLWTFSSFRQFDNRSMQRNLSYDCNVTTPTTPSTPGSSKPFQNSPPYG